MSDSTPTPLTPAHHKARRSLRYAIGLFARVEAFLHNLPDRQCPQQLLEDIRLFHHTTQADISAGRLAVLPGDFVDLPACETTHGGLAGGPTGLDAAVQIPSYKSQEKRLNDSIIVHGPMACGKTRNSFALARHFGLSNILDDQDPTALPQGVGADTLILTNVDITGQRQVSGIRCIPYAQAAAAAGIARG